MRSIAISAIALAAATVSGCASIVSDNDSATFIQTDPEVARCELHGQDFKRVINTPNSVALPAAAAPITVACKADGYRTTVEKLDTSMDGWIIGNIIFGGVIGAVIDASRGAGQKFPPQFSLVLEPERFKDETARDDWYDTRKERITTKWEKVIKEIQGQCNTNVSSDCDGKIVEAQKKKVEELDKLEANRSKAPVGSA